MIYTFADLELDIGRRQLSRKGSPVKLTKLSFQLLEALVEAAPNLLSQDELIDRVWGPRRVVSPNSLSQRMAILRQSLGDDANAPTYVEAVRGQGYRLIPDVQAQPADPSPSIEMTDAPPVRKSLKQKLPSASGRVAALAIAIAIVARILFWPTGETDYQRRADEAGRFSSVAVLPFANLSPDASHGFFAAGIHEEVLNKLSKLTGLRVISRTSMLRYADTREPIPNIARKLNVDSLVEGSVRYADNRIRVTIQVVDGHRDVHLWSETYDRELKDIFAIESEIARDVAAALHQVVADEPGAGNGKPPTNNLDAYAHYIQGRQGMARRKPRELEAAIEHFETATQLDPDYVLAWVGLADAWRLLSDYSAQKVDAVFAVRQSAVDRALELDPSSGEAWLSLASLRADQRAMEEAERYYLRSLELSPGYAQAHHWYGHFLITRVGRPEEALPYLRKAVALDPLSPATNGTLAMALWNLGRVEETLGYWRRSIESDPGNANNMLLFSEHLAQIGRLDQAMYWAREGARVDSANYLARRRECLATLTLGSDQALDQCQLDMVSDFPEDQSLKSLRYEPAIYVYRKQPALYLERMLELNEIDSSPRARWRLGSAYLYNGLVVEARDIFSKLWPPLFGEEEIALDFKQLYPAVIAGIVLRRTGETERAEYLFDKALLKMESMHRIRSPGFGYADIAIHVTRDDRGEAIGALRDAIDSGWRAGWWELRGPGFEAIHEEPEWQALYAELLDDIERQRENYYAHKDDPGYWR